MKYKSYNELMNNTLHQLSVLYSFDEVTNRKEFAILLLNIYFDALNIPESTEDRTDALKDIFEPMMQVKLAPPPEFTEKYQRMAKGYGK